MVAMLISDKTHFHSKTVMKDKQGIRYRLKGEIIIAIATTNTTAPEYIKPS